MKTVINLAAAAVGIISSGAVAAVINQEGLVKRGTKRRFHGIDEEERELKRLEREDILSKVFYDPKRNYMKVLTHLSEKEFGRSFAVLD